MKAATTLKARPPAQEGDEVIRVLLVEDDRAVVEMYRLRLGLDGYEVHTAQDGADGWKQAERLRPDIIFLDVRLPKLDGLEVLRRLHSQPATKTIPVIILSNYSEKDLVDRGFKLGAHEYLVRARTTPAKLSGSIEDWVRE